MLIIVGESGSGKSTLQKYICNFSDFEPSISTTTRPKRDGEVDGKDYHFISQEKYSEKLNNKEFVEAAIYNNWFYGVTKEEIADNKVFVATPHGLRIIKKYLIENELTEHIHLTTIYLKVDRLSRLINLLKRDGEKGIEESYRRSLSDIGQFDGIEDEVDIVLENFEYRFSVGTLWDKLKEELLNSDNWEYVQ